MNEEDQKENLPIEALLFRQIFCSGRRLAFFLRECFAIPDSLCVVPGFKDLSLVD